MEASQETCVCVSECVHYMQRDEQSGSKTEGLTSVLGQQKYFIALLKEAVMMLPKSNTSKWFTHTPAHKNTQSTLPVCWHINWSAPHSINCKVSYPAHTWTHTHLCTILALISSLCKAGDHQISPQNLHDNKNQLSQHRVESAHIPSLDTEWMQMEMQISGFKVPAGLRWRRSASDCGARLPLGGSSRSCVHAEKWGVLVEEVVQGKISEELTVQRWDEMGPSSTTPVLFF